MEQRTLILLVANILPEPNNFSSLKSSTPNTYFCGVFYEFRCIPCANGLMTEVVTGKRI